MGPLVSVIVGVRVSVAVGLAVGVALGVMVAVGLDVGVGGSLAVAVSVNVGGVIVTLVGWLASMGRLHATDIKFRMMKASIIFLMLLFYRRTCRLSR